MGRNLSRAPSTAASTIPLSFGALLAGVFDDQNRVLGAERDQEDEANLRVKIVGGDAAWLAATLMAPSVVSAATVPSRAIGTHRMTASGRIQLSYWPARTK